VRETLSPGESGALPRVSSQAKPNIEAWLVECFGFISSPESSGVVPPEKGDAMPDAINALAITLFVALLVIDRLAR
jgi:hypothetical protein